MVPVAATATDHRPSRARVIWRTALATTLASAAALGGIAATSAPPGPDSAYLAIAQVGNQRLNTDFDRVQGPDHANLAAATGDLRDIAAAERSFDHELSMLTLPPGAESTAHTLIRANEARAGLSDQAADSDSLAQLDSFQHRLAAANAPVEQSVREIHFELGLPAPDTA